LDKERIEHKDDNTGLEKKNWQSLIVLPQKGGIRFRDNE
jgi:hypothetical protein